MAKLTIIPVCSKFHNTGIGIVETWRCRVSVSTTAHKVLNINLLTRTIVGVYQNYHFNVAVETQNFASLQSG